MAVHRKIMFAKPSDHEMSFTRIFAAPAAALWRAWTNPTQLAKWYRPKGTALITHAMDVKKGGTWQYTLRSGNDAAEKNTVTYTLIKEPERLAFTHASEDSSQSHDTMLTFTAVDKDHTHVTMLLRFKDAAAMKHSINTTEADKAGSLAFGRLADFVES